MGFEGDLRAWAHEHGLWRSPLLVGAYRAVSRARFAGRWDRPVAFRGFRFRIGKDLSLYPAVRNGGFESVELDHFLRRVPGDAEVWDVGANIGIYAVLLASRARHGHVVAFEPVPETRRRLHENLELNATTNVTSHQVALSSSTGHARMGIHSSAHGCDSLLLDDQADGQIDVETMTASEFLARSGRPVPDVVKVDIEGHEPDFLDGMWDVVEARRPLLMLEVNPAAWPDAAHARRWQGTVDRLLAIYGAADWIDPGSARRIEALDVAALEPRGYAMILPPEEHA